VKLLKGRHKNKQKQTNKEIDHTCRSILAEISLKPITTTLFICRCKWHNDL